MSKPAYFFRRPPKLCNSKGTSFTAQGAYREDAGIEEEGSSYKNHSGREPSFGQSYFEEANPEEIGYEEDYHEESNAQAEDKAEGEAKNQVEGQESGEEEAKNCVRKAD